MRIAAVTLAAGLVLGTAIGHAEEESHHQRSPDDRFELVALGNGLHVLYGRGGNVGFTVGSEAVLVVDSQFQDLAPGIVAKIRSVTDKPIRYLVNTHHHSDHVGGNGEFRSLAVIIAHHNVRERMLATPQQILRDTPALLEQAKAAGDADRVSALQEQLDWAGRVRVEEIPAPVLTYGDEVRVYVGDQEIQVWHTPPAHTDGDSIVYFPAANVAHMGDVFFNEIHPRVDVGGGGSVSGYIAALDAVAQRLPADARVIPGHGRVTGVGGLQKLKQYAVDLLEAARAARAAGRSRQEFVEHTQLPQYAGWEGQQRYRDNLGAAWDEAG